MHFWANMELTGCPRGRTKKYGVVQGVVNMLFCIALIDTEYPNFSRRVLIVGLSRATNGQVVHVADNEVEILGRAWSAN